MGAVDGISACDSVRILSILSDTTDFGNRCICVLKITDHGIEAVLFVRLSEIFVRQTATRRSQVLGVQLPYPAGNMDLVLG